MKLLLTFILAYSLTNAYAVHSIEDAAPVMLAHHSASAKLDPLTLESGQLMFRKNCARCHGWTAEGITDDWSKRDENGKYPPPPLNGTAHTWHHSLNSLLGTIREGSEKIGGSMPSFKDKLNDEEAMLILIWITSLWPEDLYKVWKNNIEAQ